MAENGYLELEPQGRVPPVFELAFFFAGYMLSLAFGNWLILAEEIPITLWPPNGVVLAMLMTHGKRTWGWWVGLAVLGELLGNYIWFNNPFIWAVGYVIANTLAVYTAALVLGRIFPIPLSALRTLRQVQAFLGIGVISSPLISATIGSAIDAFLGKNPFGTTWPIWWLGDATGILIAAPLVISIVNAHRRPVWPRPAQLMEAALLGLFLAGLSFWVLSWGGAFAFLLIIPVLWAALRFGFQGTTAAVLVLTIVIGIYEQNVSVDEIATREFLILRTRLQSLILVTATIGLILAATIAEQRDALAKLARVNSDLEDRVRARTREIEETEKRFRATFENAGVGIALLELNGQIIEVNEKLAEMLGYTPGELNEAELGNFTDPSDANEETVRLGALIEGEVDVYELEKRFLHRDGSTVWGRIAVSPVRNEGSEIKYLIYVVQDITERKKSDAINQVLMKEVNHRAKNMLSVVQVIARQTAALTPDRFMETFSDRLQALSRNQTLLVNSEWERVGLEELVRGQLEHFGQLEERVRISGPSLTVSAKVAQTLGMALHELGTNAAKYGSLSGDTGWVEVSWSIEADTFWMEWREQDGPKTAAKPSRTGFGTTVIKTMTASSLSGEVDLQYHPKGLVWRLECPLAELTEGTES